ncbi:MAG: LysE family transporter [Paracoccaceae bacterium]|nr:LysE family transporter [Paracoccaceae bacterium]
MENVLTLMAAILALMGSPGPVTLASAAAGAAFDRGAAARFVVAATTGTWTVIAIVALGVGGLVMSLPGVAPVIAGLAGAYILYLAWRIAMAPPLGALESGSEAARPIEGYIIGIANPKAYGAMGALFSGFPLIAGNPLSETVIKALLLCACALIINLTWMQAGVGLARIMQDPRASRALNITFGVMLVASVIAMLFL